MSQVSFRRLGGRIVPITKGQGKKLAVLGAAATTGAAAATVLKGKKKNRETQASAFKLSSTALAIGAGIVSGLPLGGGAKGFIKSTALAFGIDAAGVAANAAHAARLKGTRKEKTKAFLKQEGVNIAAGYTAMGATLLANKSIRNRLAQWGVKLLLK